MLDAVPLLRGLEETIYSLYGVELMWQYKDGRQGSGSHNYGYSMQPHAPRVMARLLEVTEEGTRDARSSSHVNSCHLQVLGLM